jgi:hypothetical protein
MSAIPIEQAIYRRRDGESPQLVGRSPGFADSWLPLTEELIRGFGERPAGVRCGAAVFARPLANRQVAVVQVADQELGQPTLAFRVLALPLADYVRYLGDPFAVSDRFPPCWGEKEPLPALTMPAEPLPPRTVEDVQRVLQRVKAHALREDQDPDDELPPEVRNAESPALLGGVQVLVDGGRVVFERPAPDDGLMRGLWTLLPTRTRCDLWPASFAFGNALGFDALIVPSTAGGAFAGYTTEDQAADYPQGNYELSLQTAAEAGNQQDLDALLSRRSWKDTWRLGLTILAVMLGVLLFQRLTAPPPREAPPAGPPSRAATLPRAERLARLQATVAAVGAAEPLPALSPLHLGETLPPRLDRLERIGTAVAVVSVGDRLAALNLLYIGNTKWGKSRGTR